MTCSLPNLTRRTLLAGLGGTLLTPILPTLSLAQARSALELQAKSGPLTVKPGTTTEAWMLANAQQGPLRYNRGDEIEVQFDNQLPSPLALSWRGIDGVPGIVPLLERRPVATGGKDRFRLPLRHAGTSILDMRLLGDGVAPSQVRSLVVQETEPVAVDRDEVVLIEDFRLGPDGGLLAPGVAPGEAASLFLFNRKPALDLTARLNERLRLRLINGCQRNVIALKFDGREVRVMAIDGQPAEPFPARNSQVVLAPNTRIDVFIDATGTAGTGTDILLHDGKSARPIGRLTMSAEPALRDQPLPPAAPLPSNGLPNQIELKNAARFEMTVGAPDARDWIRPADLTATMPPAFKAKAGRTVVLALTNRATVPAVFQLYGHHFRLLDRLDDGWKPFWLDTLALDAGQTQRIAFSAQHAGRWLMETFVTDWSAPRLVRWYGVE